LYFVFTSVSSASKCDDISCSEVIRALGIHDDPELERIEAQIEDIEDESIVWKEAENEAQKHVKGLPKFGVLIGPLRLTVTSSRPRT